MKLPLTNNPSETFSVEIFEVIYQFRQLWNTLGFWTLDIADVEGVEIINGVKIVTRTSLLGQYPEVRFDLFMTDESDPGRDDLEEASLNVVNKDG